MSQNRPDWNINTKLNHPQDVVLPEGNRPLLQPIYHSAKFSPSDNSPYWDQFLYSRISNPTTRQLELSLAELQGREECLVLGSGIAAITGTFLALLASGDHIISFRELYRPARVYIRDILPRYGIEHSLLKLSQVAELEDYIIPGKTKLIHFESPTNPNLDIADIEVILRVAKKNNILVSMDGTFAGPHQHTQFDIDLMIQSLTKFGNGHGDVIAGSVAGKKELINRVREMSIYLGATLDPQAAYLIARGLKTYMLRFERQNSTAGKIVDFLSSHPRIKKVRYPGLSHHPGHLLAKKQMKDMGAIVAFEIDPSVAASADKFCHTLKLIQLTASLGSTESIICPTDTFFGQDLAAQEKEEMGISSYSLRLSVGLEEASDLIQDLKQALEKVNS
jgi:cystathionine beta-lyase/cystathionine gamma-synthase